MSRFSLDRLKELRPGKSEGRPVPETSSTSQDDQQGGLSRSYSGPDRPTSFAGQLLSSSYSEADAAAVATSTIRVVELDSSGVVTQAISGGDGATIVNSSPEIFHDMNTPCAPSPMKERLLCAFARIAPDTSAKIIHDHNIRSGSDTMMSLPATAAASVSSDTDSAKPSFRTGSGASSLQTDIRTEATGSWYHQVKGRFTKSSTTPSTTTSSAKDSTSPSAAVAGSTSPSSLGVGENTPTYAINIRAATSEEESAILREPSICHSLSDINIGNQQEETETVKKRPQSQIFDFESTDWSQENAATSKEKSGNEISEDDNICLTPSMDTPTKVRKRFGMSFLDRTGSNSPNKTSAPSSKPGTPVKPPASAETPRRSLRNFVMKSFKQTPSESNALPTECGVADLMIEGGYPQGADSNLGPPSLSMEDGKHTLDEDLTVDESAVEAEEEEYTWNSDYDINQYGHMKGEAKTANKEAAAVDGGGCRVHKVPVLVNPVIVLILAVINFTGLFPGWLSGFLTGLILCGILSITILLVLNPAVSYAPTRQENHKPAQIQVFEEPPLTQAWMNLLPQKFHPYDCETYQVKNTISVRVTIEHHMLKIEYPEKNISMRQTADEVIPPDLKFHLHTDHIDLSTASIRLLPDKLANSKKFKKKYPIEIRPNGLKPGHEANVTANPCPEFEGSDGELEEYSSVDGSPLSRSPVSSAAHTSIADLNRQDSTKSLLPGGGNKESKAFYLFARSDREKEDIYKALLDGHHFLEDSFRDADRMQGIYTPPNSRMTARERSQFFTDFMSKVMDAPTAKYPNSPETPTFTGSAEVQYPEWCAHFLNVYIYRIFYDVHQNRDLTEMIMKKVNNKLAKVKELKYFKYIGITNLNFGRTTPQIKWVSRPTQNARGLWTHVGLEYEGCITVSIEISGLNLLEDAPGGGVQFKMLMEEDPGALPVKTQGQGTREWSRLEAATNSDEEDSDESDSEEQDITGIDGEHGQSTRKWWEIVQENDLVKSGLSRLSATCWWKSKVENIDFTLRLEVRKIKGVLVLNIPPPPSDRLWFAFKTSPELDIRMLSYFGEDLLGDDSSFKSTIINKVFQLVNTKIQEEVVKLVVLPNMIDIPLKIMDGLPYSNIPEQNMVPDPRTKINLGS